MFSFKRLWQLRTLSSWGVLSFISQFMFVHIPTSHSRLSNFDTWHSRNKAIQRCEDRHRELSNENWLDRITTDQHQSNVLSEATEDSRDIRFICEDYESSLIQLVFPDSILFFLKWTYLHMTYLGILFILFYNKIYILSRVFHFNKHTCSHQHDLWHSW